MAVVPSLRVRVANDAVVNHKGDYVLYWMIAARRTRFNFALDRALEWVRQLAKPLVVFEPLRIAYPWASDRLHRFIIEGMRDNQRRFAAAGVCYFPYVEPQVDAGKELLATLAARAAVVVTDEFPVFFLPRMVNAVASRLAVKLEAIDSNGILPLRAADQEFVSAYQFRRYLQKNLRPYLAELPDAEPLHRPVGLPPVRLPAEVTSRWPVADLAALVKHGDLAQLTIDHTVVPGLATGGSAASELRLRKFLDTHLDRYVEDRNEPQIDASSGLSPYLHFGHIASQEIFAQIARRESWSSERLAEKTSGSRSGWWGMSENAEAFLDQLITWRELGFNMCARRDDFDQYESLPAWARKTLADHARDRREHVYSLEDFEQAGTHDPLWNAAQLQLVREGRLHNYLRMLWGKKILEWSVTPQDALAVMIELNNKYALDGRDPNSYSGIFWVLGRYDRAWGPERPIFGKIRYMSSENTARKVSVANYIEKYIR